jgi:acid phosphatase
MIAMAASKQDISKWDKFQWRRKMEVIGNADEAVIATGPRGEIEGICQSGELTDKGRETTFALGQRLRHLYVDQLGFMPRTKSDAEDMYLRSSPIPRALESLHQAFWGMYPASARTTNFLSPVIVTRAFADETIYPNEVNCRRFRQLSTDFAQRAADKWNNSEEIEYLNKLWSKWMPASSPRIAVDSRPRLSGITDTVNASLAHGPATRLPPIFYDEKARKIMDKITVDEWYSGYKESVEYRKLGIGALLGDIVERMVSTAIGGGWRMETTSPRAGQTGNPIKFSLNGCHDTTIAAILASLGGFEAGKWPQFTSSIAIELFSTVDSQSIASSVDASEISTAPAAASPPPKRSGFLSFFIGHPSPSQSQSSNPREIGRKPLDSFPESAKRGLRNHYVRIRYNDDPVRIPGCAAKETNHLPGDDTFCTLEAFKEIVDKFTPRSWKKECLENIDEGLFGKGDREKVQAGY